MFSDPALAYGSAAHFPQGCDFEMGCFGTPQYGNPGVNWNSPGYFPNYGILGASDYQGGWTAEVDFVNWYQNNTKSTIWTPGTLLLRSMALGLLILVHNTTHPLQVY